MRNLLFDGRRVPDTKSPNKLTRDILNLQFTAISLCFVVTSAEVYSHLGTVHRHRPYFRNLLHRRFPCDSQIRNCPKFRHPPHVAAPVMRAARKIQGAPEPMLQPSDSQKSQSILEPDFAPPAKPSACPWSRPPSAAPWSSRAKSAAPNRSTSMGESRAPSILPTPRHHWTQRQRRRQHQRPRSCDPGQGAGQHSVTDRLDIRSEGSLTGDVITQRISVEDGAILKGSVQVRAVEHKNAQGQASRHRLSRANSCGRAAEGCSRRCRRSSSVLKESARARSQASPYLFLTSRFLCRLQIQRRRIHAVAQASRRGAIFENVAQVGIATCAAGFGANHAISLVGVVYHRRLVHAAERSWASPCRTRTWCLN